MTFLWPQYLWLLLALPLLVAVYFWLLRRRKTLLLYSSVSLVQQAMGRLPWRRHVPPALLLLALAVLMVAASRPMAKVSLPTDHATIILAMDVSLSMRAGDVKPNRLVAAQEAAKAFLAELPKNIKVGIVTFAGSAQLVQPATLNREDLVAAIDRFQMQMGTAVGSGIVASLAELFPDEGIDLGEMTFGERRQRGKSLDQTAKAAAAETKKEVVPVAPGSYASAAIILLTDGRRTTGVDTQEAAQMAANHGVRVYSVGLGTVDGEVAGGEGWAMYLRLDEPSLKAVAAATQGEYFYAGTAESLRVVYQKLSSRMQVEKKETELSGLLALAASLLAVASAVLSLWWFNRTV